MACSRGGHVFATSVNDRSCKKKSPCHALLLFAGENMIPNTRHPVCNIRIYGASSACEGENFRRLESTKRPKHEKYNRPSLEA